MKIRFASTSWSVISVKSVAYPTEIVAFGRTSLFDAFALICESVSKNTHPYVYDHIPPHLWIVHRPETERALIIRRGPGKVTGFFGWNRRTNEVTVGQWMKSKVYPFRADISPKGNYVIYFSLNGYWNSETKGAYTVASCSEPRPGNCLRHVSNSTKFPHPCWCTILMNTNLRP